MGGRRFSALGAVAGFIAVFLRSTLDCIVLPVILGGKFAAAHFQTPWGRCKETRLADMDTWDARDSGYPGPVDRPTSECPVFSGVQSSFLARPLRGGVLL